MGIEGDIIYCVLCFINRPINWLLSVGRGEDRYDKKGVEGIILVALYTIMTVVPIQVLLTQIHGTLVRAMC